MQQKTRNQSNSRQSDHTAPAALALAEPTKHGGSTLDRAWKVLELTKSFANHQDFKPSPILTLDTAILALVGAAVMQKPEILADSPLACLFLALTVFLLVASGYNVMRVLSPRLGHRPRSVPFIAVKPTENTDVRTQIFFHDITRATNGKNEHEVLQATQLYAKALKRVLADDDELYRQVAEQIVANARVASYKSQALHDACVCLFLGLACVAGAIVTLVLTLTAQAK